MYKQFLIEFEKLNIDKDVRIYLAISGGTDSMVLSHLLHYHGIEHTLLHCNFQLRGKESGEDELFVQNYAQINNIEFISTSFETKIIAKEENLSIQECARNLRYSWFSSFLKKEQSILLTAHHLDDSIETFFINLLRGTGIKGLTGIPNGKNKIFRPLLSFDKKEIKSFIEQNNIKYREDSSNSSDNYLRNNLRHHFIPEFKKLTTNFESKISTLFDELTETNNFIELFLAPFQTSLHSEGKISKTDLQKIPQFMWHRLFSTFGIIRKNNIELIKLVNSKNGSIFETRTHTLLNNRGFLFLSVKQSKSITNIKIDENLNDISISNHTFKFEIITNLKRIKFAKNVAFLDYDKIAFPLTLRHWQQGDRIQPLGMKGSKIISDILINNKLNRFEKELQTIFESNNKIIWLTDLVISNQFSIVDTTKKVLKIEHIQY